MNLYPCDYSTHAALIEMLLHEQPNLLLIDTRHTPRSRIPAWSQAALERRFGVHYRWVDATLGNINHALTMEVRRYGLAQVKAIQAEVNRLEQAQGMLPRKPGLRN